MKRLSLILLAPITLGLSLITGCANPVPNDYVPQLVIEGFVIAGEPITHLRVYKSLPVSDTFSLAKATIRDAKVVLLEDGVPVPLAFAPDSLGGGNYVPVDTTFRVKYETTYSLEVHAIDKTATASARTMQKFDWVLPPADTIRYPGKENELKPVDSLGISWQGQTGIVRYVIGLQCLDTLEYGKYLTPPTTEKNARVRDEDIEQGTLIADERTRYGFSVVSNTPVVWAAFKWYGPQRIVVYAGDKAFQDWFTLVGFGQRPTYDYRISNVSGGLGIFAGASKTEAPMFLLKQN